MTDPQRVEHRVIFDFEVDFSNGGGLQGQEFRLDIEGDRISDEELAAFLIRDLSLLMVSDVRIVRKETVQEQHKRRRPARADDTTGNGRLVDLSHSVEDGMVTYRGLPAPVVCDFLSREESRSHYDEGTEFQIGRIDMCANTGTYVDSPFHRYADGADLAQLPLDRLADLEAVKVDVTGASQRAIGHEHFRSYDVRGKAVLVYTGWDRHWRTDDYFENHPFLTADAASLLADQGAALVGIDSLNIDDTDDGARPVHSTLLAQTIPVCEHLTNLGELPESGWRFSAVPVKVRGMGTFPVRAYGSVR
jgi:kynurenine formamidase